jgi:hypothetical protein
MILLLTPMVPKISGIRPSAAAPLDDDADGGGALAFGVDDADFVID